MDTEIKNDWIAALRSPRYQQARGRLKTLLHYDDDEYIPAVNPNRPRSHTGMCCLGVLCDRLDPDGWLPEVEGTSPQQGIGHRLGNEWRTELSESTLHKLGISQFEQGTLVNLNDQKHLTLPQIADFIEANFE